MVSSRALPPQSVNAIFNLMHIGDSQAVSNTLQRKSVVPRTTQIWAAGLVAKEAELLRITDERQSRVPIK